MKAVITLALFLAVACTATGQVGTKKETLTNQTVLQLHKAGLALDLIKTKIASSDCAFDLSTDGLLALSKAGLPGDVIAAMFAKQSGTPTQAPPARTRESLASGLYLLDAKTQSYTELEPSVLTNTKSGGFGEAMKRSMISGLINAKTRATLAGASAPLTVSPTPTIIFVFDTGEKQSLGASNSFLSTAQNPNEFFLVKLAVVKNTREVVVGKSNDVSQDVGIDDKLKVSFTSRKVRPGVYEVSPNAPLAPGQYCFIAASSTTTQGAPRKVYDFGVK